ncbi:hypothetical protein F4859DRAFT_505795 [Xylaria cf. heliscus]|nr:hypothetical protein F4859DRAFT_505795 [Xylaria cf. heliscus]
MSLTSRPKGRLNDVDEHSTAYPLKQSRYADEYSNAASEATNTNTPDQRKLTNGDYTVGWVTALSIERAAALVMLDEFHQKLPKKPGDNNNYAFGRIGDHNVIIASLPDDGYGTINAATVASNMHRTFPSLEVFLMVGIAGGAPGISRLIQYDLGKALSEGRFETTAIPIRPSQALRNAVTALRARHEFAGSKIPTILRQIAKQYPQMEEYAYRDSLKDLLFKSTYDHPESDSACDQCEMDDSRLVKRTPRRNSDPVIHYGVIASGDQVIKYATTRDKLAQQFKALCFEMEGAGFIESLQCLVIRSICDYADSHKNKRWQKYAAATAAAYTKELLGEMPILETQASKTVETEMSTIQKRELMNALSFQSMYSREGNIEPAQYTTCEWILQHPIYSTWLDIKTYPQSNGFLWIRGKPGAGKSTLMKFISMNASKNATVISSFFNARGGDLEKSVEGMYRSLLHQLLEKLPDLPLLDHPFLRLLPSRAHFEWNIRILQELFSKAITGLDQQQLICFVDALDECDISHVRGMVKYFEGLGRYALEKKLKLFICFSSRHYPAISIKYGLTLVLEDQPGHNQDLEKYINQELDIIEEEEAHEIKGVIIRKAAGVFLWVVLVVQILNEDYLGGRMFGLKARLDKIPSELYDLFRNILKKDSNNEADLLLSIQWILYAKRPLEPIEYYYAMAAGLNPGRDSLARWDPKKVPAKTIAQFISSSSKGLAEITKSPYLRVQFIHESVRDFLIKDRGVYELWPNLQKDFRSRSHDRLKECCYAYIKARSFERESLDSGLEKDYSTTDVYKSIPFPFLKYATDYVLRHADMAAIGVSQQDFLKTFDVRTWIRLNNLLGGKEYYEYTLAATIFYILAHQGYVRLIDNAVAVFGAMHPHIEAVDAILRVGNSLIDRNSVFPQLRPDCKTLKINQETPLLLAARVGHEEVVQLLLDQGIMPNATDSKGRASLAFDAMFGNRRVAQMLLDTAEINWRNKYGKTPFLDTMEYRHSENVKLLLDRGAKDNLRDKYGQTPLVVASQYRYLETIKLLLSRGAEVNSRDEHGWAPLFNAVANCSTEIIVEILLAHGAHINVRDHDGRAPLSWAIKSGNIEVAEMLLAHSAYVNVSDNDGNTPLCWTAMGCCIATVEMLLSHGTEVDILNEWGMTSLDLAIEFGREEIVEVLRGRLSQIRDVANEQKCRKSVVDGTLPACS